MPQHRHLIVRGLGKASDKFEPYGGGSARRPSRVGDRSGHAGHLRGDLAELADHIRSARAEQAIAGVAGAKSGVTVSVASREGEQIVVGDARRANSRGMQLLTVLRRADIGNRRGQDRAVLFMTGKALESLERSLLEYESWDGPELADADAMLLNEPEETAGGRRPRNFWFFESVDSFKVAKVEDLWTDALESFPRERGRSSGRSGFGPR
jgi:hypothetical protein